MAEPKSKTWVDGSTGGTPITAAELNRMESGIAKALGSDAVYPPASPNVRDDEFDGTSTATWSNTPTAPTSTAVNGTVPNSLLLTTSGLASKHVGLLQSAPATPFTVTTRLMMTQANGAFQKSGLILGPTSPTGASSAVLFGLVVRTDILTYMTRWSGTFDGTFANELNRPYTMSRPPLWLRMVVNSATSVDLLWSAEGKHWVTHTAALNPGFTPGVIGLTVNDEAANSGMSSVFDFFRVT